MAKLLFKEGEFKILSDDVGKLSGDEILKMIKIAGTTCYQKRETSKKTPVEFFQIIQKNRHYAMTEHSWRTIEIGPSSGTRDMVTAIEKIGFHLYKANNLFCITERPSSLLISGNVRMFNEAWIKTGSIFICGIQSLLAQENPILFSQYVHFDSLDSKDLKIVTNPKLTTKKEILIHRAMTVEFNKNSRGMTHETVRSRNGDEKITSYAQESTRYVDYAKGEMDLEQFQIKFILPYNDEFNFEQRINFSSDGVDYSFTPQEFTNLIENWYRALRKSGLRPEEARQWLPIGIKSQIVQTYNLNEWHHWFFLRTNKAAHPEIRFLAVNLLKEVQKRIPECFNDFQISEDGESAIYQEEDPLV